MARAPRRAASPRGPLDPAELIEAACAGGAPPVLLVTGRDYFTRDAILEALRRALVTEGFEAFNFVSCSGEETSARELLTQAEVLPLAAAPGGRRLILVRRAERIKEKDAAVIAEYASAPAPTACLVFVCDQARNPIGTALRKAAALLDFPAPRDYQLARWLEAQARRMKTPIDPDAARALAALMGENYIGAMSELQRAALAARPGRGRITLRIIEDLAARGRDTNPFHLGDAVLSREAARAVGILRDLAEAGMTGYAVLGMLEGQLRRFLKMRAKVDQGEPARSVAQSASPTLPPDVKARLARQLESFDEPRLIEAFRIARQTDRAIKGAGSGSELAHLESLVWRICAL